MNNRIPLYGLRVDERLFNLVRDDIAPGTGVDPDSFWAAFSRIVQDLGSRNRQLLEQRNELQNRIDRWYAQRAGLRTPAEQKEFLQEIGYLEPESPVSPISTAHVDPEISVQAGPQLVVPVDNARYALNAANARWGSLYDALYGTDAIPEDEGREASGAYNPVRGTAVIQWAERMLDRIFPLTEGRHGNVTAYSLGTTPQGFRLECKLESGQTAQLQDPAQYVGHRQDGEELTLVLLVHNHLHVELHFDRQHPVGRTHPAGLKDIVIEAAVTTIQDFEDSVAAVDTEDKVRVYSNWCHIMKGDLETTFEKNRSAFTRRLAPDRNYTAPDGADLTLPGRSLLLVRHVGLHMYTDAVTTDTGQAVPEGFLDAMVATLAALHDLRQTGSVRNSRTGSVYVVKPKLHGSGEVQLTLELFAAVETALELEPNTIKLGIMDEERRTTVNLGNAIQQARERVVFINTGFLDRTGDELHTSMRAGAMLPKSQIREQPWLSGYEDWNVDQGLRAGFAGRAQIGKGMWTMPDALGEMLNTKMNHPRAGASTAWVPSPTAATLHALHYHLVDVHQRQRELAAQPPVSIDDILRLPLMEDRPAAADIQKELDNNLQGILGYVVRWVNQGIGCSKVPDINGIGLMEDRATLRISSQHVANWLLHGVVTPEQVRSTFARMAAVVDAQNAGEEEYIPMTPDLEDSQAFQAAQDLVFQGTRLPNGYTEPILHARRRAVKAQAAFGIQPQQ